MTKIAFVIYRQWTFEIFLEIENYLQDKKDCICPLFITVPEHEFSLPKETPNLAVKVIEPKNQAAIAEALLEHDIDVVCFFGWSWIVKEPLLTDYICLCLHPSPLPKYRGGSPIQNQLVAGESLSAISLIKMSAGIDDGDIYGQIPFSLEGDLNAILDKMIISGTEITRQFIDDCIESNVMFRPQVGLDSNPPLKRRTNADGEIKIASAALEPYSRIYNLVRGLIKPYPNAYIILEDGTLYLEAVQKMEVPLVESQILKTNTKGDTLNFSKPVLIEVSEGYAHITKSHFVVLA